MRTRGGGAGYCGGGRGSRPAERCPRREANSTPGRGRAAGAGRERGGGRGGRRTAGPTAALRLRLRSAAGAARQDRPPSILGPPVAAGVPGRPGASRSARPAGVRGGTAERRLFAPRSTGPRAAGGRRSPARPRRRRGSEGKSREPGRAAAEDYGDVSGSAAPDPSPPRPGAAQRLPRHRRGSERPPAPQVCEPLSPRGKGAVPPSELGSPRLAPPSRSRQRRCRAGSRRPQPPQRVSAGPGTRALSEPRRPGPAARSPADRNPRRGRPGGCGAGAAGAERASGGACPVLDSRRSAAPVPAQRSAAQRSRRRRCLGSCGTEPAPRFGAVRRRSLSLFRLSAKHTNN